MEAVEFLRWLLHKVVPATNFPLDSKSKSRVTTENPGSSSKLSDTSWWARGEVTTLLAVAQPRGIASDSKCPFCNGAFNGNRICQASDEMADKAFFGEILQFSEEPRYGEAGSRSVVEPEFQGSDSGRGDVKISGKVHRKL